jgi:GTP-binding protein Era
MVAVVGRASTGKSTLINTILGEKISIVSPIAQTTRNLIRGVLTEPRGQIVLLDTPGIHQASGHLGKIMNRTARAAVAGVDAVALVVDGASRPRNEDEGWMRRLLREESACFVLLNKQDRGKPHEDAYRALWKKAADEIAPGREAQWLCLSAKKGEGVKEVVDALFPCMPEGPYLFPEDMLTDFPRMIAIADLIREKLLRHLHEDLPHSIAVNTDSIKEEGHCWDIHATIYVKKFSQKGIVIGNKGRLIRAVKRSAERQLAEIYEKDVTLKLWVKIEKNWTQNFWILKKLGYVG